MNNCDSLPSLGKEARMMCLLSMKDITDCNKEEINELIKSKVDWNYFFDLVKKNRIYPIVYRNLSVLGCENINNKILRDIGELSKANLIASMKLTYELIKVMKTFKESNIRVFSLKGPALGNRIYGDSSLRMSHDLDILVEEENIHRAEEVLRGLGYLPIDFEKNLTEKQRNISIKQNHHLGYKNRENILVELHWRYSYEQQDVAFESIWNEKDTVTIGGEKISLLSKEEELLYLIFHGAKHGYFRLKWMLDIVEIIKNNNLDWELFLKKSKNLDMEDIVAQTNILCKYLFSVTFPISLKESKNAVRLASLSISLMLEEESKNKKNMKKYTYLRLNGFKAKTQYILKHFKPQVIDYNEIELEDRYYFLYYFLRPLLKLKRIIKE